MDLNETGPELPERSSLTSAISEGNCATASPRFLVRYLEQLGMYVLIALYARAPPRSMRYIIKPPVH